METPKQQPMLTLSGPIDEFKNETLADGRRTLLLIFSPANATPSMRAVVEVYPIFATPNTLPV